VHYQLMLEHAVPCPGGIRELLQLAQMAACSGTEL